MIEWNTDDEYRTRGGEPARYIGKTPAGDCVFYVHCIDRWVLVNVHPSGRREGPRGRDNRDDILPPRRIVWVLMDLATGRPAPSALHSTHAPSEAPPVGKQWRRFVEDDTQEQAMRVVPSASR